MVIIAVAALFLAFGAVGLIRLRRCEAVNRAASIVPELSDYLYHKGHTWIAPVGRGLYKVGLNDLAASLTGLPEKVRHPGAGYHTFEGVRQIRVVNGSRTLALASPLSGEVLRVNRRAREDPALVARDPYKEGWLFLIRPKRRREADRLLDFNRARTWLDELRRRVSTTTLQPAAVTAWDSGPMKPGYGEHLSDDQFEQLKTELFSASS